MHSLQRQFELRWEPYRAEALVLVACSGGPDSVALLNLLARTQGPPSTLAVAHFNHRLRGDAADRDAEFVQALSARFGMPFEIGIADPDELQHAAKGEGLESAARRLRYAFLVETAERLGARYVATGHTSDDQVETVLHHVVRGTGLKGLAGMARVRTLTPAVTLVRPMLDIRREQILDYLRDLGQDFRDDDHNTQRQFMRSRIRIELLPLLEREYSPHVRDAVLRLSRIAREANDTIGNLAEHVLDNCIKSRVEEDVVELDGPTLAHASVHVRREAFVCLWRRRGWPLQAMTFDHWQRLATVVVGATGETAFDLPGPIHVECHTDGPAKSDAESPASTAKHRTSLVIRPMPPADNAGR